MIGARLSQQVVIAPPSEGYSGLLQSQMGRLQL